MPDSVPLPYLAHHKPLNGYPAAQLRAVLETRQGCLMLRGADGEHFLPLWPVDVRISEADPTVIEDDRGVIGRVGATLLLDGGAYQSSEAGFALSLIDGASPPKSCAAQSFWLVASVNRS